MTELERDRPRSETSGSEQRPARRVSAPVLSFDLAAELASLKTEASWQRGDRNSRTLVEDPGFRLVLTALKTGTVLGEHRAAGWVSVQALDGHLRMHVGDLAADLNPGQVVVLEPDVVHGVEALTEGAFLLSIAFVGQSHTGG